MNVEKAVAIITDVDNLHLDLLFRIVAIVGRGVVRYRRFLYLAFCQIIRALVNARNSGGRPGLFGLFAGHLLT